MKKLISYFMAIGLVLLMASGVAMAGNDNGCKVQGSWISYEDGVPTWMAGLHGQSASSGTNELEYPAFGVNLGIPPFAGTHMRGAWERTGGNTFDYTMMGYGYDPENGAPIYVARMNGTLALSEDCNNMAVTATVNLYFCGLDTEGTLVCPDPYVACPVVEPGPPPVYPPYCMIMPILPSTGYRVMVE